MREIFLTSDLSISGDFEQVCFLWQKSTPPPGWGKIFWLWIYPFQVILSKFGFWWQKSPPPSFLPFGEILGSCCSTWRNFTDWYFMHHWISHWWQVGRKVHPTRWGINFWLQIYPFQAILSKFGFCGRKAPPPPGMRENFSDFGSIHFRWFWATLLFVAEKPPPPGWRENFLTLHLSISGDIEQLCFFWQKSPPPLFLPFGEILSLCCSTWCNFKDWYFMHHWISRWWQVGRKAPPPQDEGNFFDFRFIHFRQFWATLVFVAEKPPPSAWGKIFWLWIYQFQVILSKFGFCGRKAPPTFQPFDEENFLTVAASMT